MAFYTGRVKFSLASLKYDKWWAILILPSVALLILCRPQAVMQAGHPRQYLPGLGAPAIIITWSPDGRQLACASFDGSIQTWNSQTQRWQPFSSTRRPSAYRTLPTRLYFSLNGRQLFAPEPRNGVSVQVFDTQAREAQWNFSGPCWSAFAMSRDRKLAASGDETGIVLNNLSSRQLPPNPKGFYGPTRRKFAGLKFFRTGSAPSCLAFSPDGRTLAVGWNAQIFLLDTRSSFKTALRQSDLQGNSLPPLTYRNDSPDTFKFEWNSPIFMEWSPDGHSLAVLSKDSLSIFDEKLHLQNKVSIGQVKPVGRTIPGAQSGIGANLVWNRNSKTLWSGGDEVRQWQARNLTQERSFGVSGPVALSPDESILATASNESPGVANGVWQWKLR